MVAAIVSALLGVLVFGFFLAGSDGGIFTFGNQIDALVAFLSTMAVALGILDLVAGTTAAIIRYKMNSGQYQQVKNNHPYHSAAKLSLGGIKSFVSHGKPWFSATLAVQKQSFLFS